MRQDSVCYVMHFEKKIVETIPDISINGVGAERLPNTSNVRLHGALADAVMNRTGTIEISSGRCMHLKYHGTITRAFGHGA